MMSLLDLVLRCYPKSFSANDVAELRATSLDVLEQASAPDRARALGSLVAGGLRQRVRRGGGVNIRETVLWGSFNGAIGVLATSAFGRLAAHRARFDSLTFGAATTVLLFGVLAMIFGVLIRTRSTLARVLSLSGLTAFVALEGRVGGVRGSNFGRFQPGHSSLTAISAMVIAALVVGGLAIVARSGPRPASVITTVTFAAIGVIPAMTSQPTLNVIGVRELVGAAFVLVAVASALVDPRWILTAAAAQVVVAAQTVVWLRHEQLSTTIVPVQFGIVSGLVVVSTFAVRRYGRRSVS